MIIFLLFIAFIGAIFLIFHISIELNNLEKSYNKLKDKIQKYYGLKADY